MKQFDSPLNRILGMRSMHKRYKALKQVSLAHLRPNDPSVSTSFEGTIILMEDVIYVWCRITKGRGQLVDRKLC